MSPPRSRRGGDNSGYQTTETAEWAQSCALAPGTSVPVSRCPCAGPLHSAIAVPLGTSLKTRRVHVPSTTHRETEGSHSPCPSKAPPNKGSPKSLAPASTGLGKMEACFFCHMSIFTQTCCNRNWGPPLPEGPDWNNTPGEEE